MSNLRRLILGNSDNIIIYTPINSINDNSLSNNLLSLFTNDIGEFMSEALDTQGGESVTTPTSEYTINNLEYFKFKNIINNKENSDNTQEDTCPVCQDKFNENEKCVKIPCGHVYHLDCLLPWLNTNNTCPVCRDVINIEEELNNKEEINKIIININI